MSLQYMYCLRRDVDMLMNLASSYSCTRWFKIIDPCYVLSSEGLLPGGWEGWERWGAVRVRAVLCQKGLLAAGPAVQGQTQGNSCKVHGPCQSGTQHVLMIQGTILRLKTKNPMLH